MHEILSLIIIFEFLIIIFINYQTKLLIMGAKEDIAAAFAKINTATNNIAADIKTLAGKIQTGGLTAEENDD